MLKGKGGLYSKWESLKRSKKRHYFLIICVLCSSTLMFSQTPRSFSFYRDSCRYDIKYYRMNIEMTDTSSFIRNDVTIKIKSLDNLATLFFEFSSSLTVDSVFIGNTRVSFGHEEDLLKISAVPVIPADRIADIRICYHGIVVAKGMFGGFSNEKDSRYNRSVTWSLSEPFYTHEWLPCKQYLPDRFDSCDVNITVPDTLKAASNGLLKAVVPVGKDKVCYRWSSRYPMTYYLIFVAAANYQEYSYYMHFPKPTFGLVNGITAATLSSDEPDSLLIQNYIYNVPGYLRSVKDELDDTRTIMLLYSRLFGPYPYMHEKYGHVQSPFGGGMEHQTMSLMFYFEFHLVAHEMSHQWFGDYVTCSDWQNIFILSLIHI